ncbi:MAG TPA: hypothetical protein PK302_01840 [Candidatus Woesebacteria bacterium]|nr:hypothetical protein [Candidatus Woesebacteria bacterium]HPA61985.1 hypothetical protein [Candidatus Woesebacteria bacterium]
MIDKMLKYQSKLLFILFLASCFLCSFKPAQAAGEVMGMHILHPEEITQVRRIYDDEVWRYVTIPLTLADTQDWGRWQNFFYQAYQQQLIPIIRLATRYDSTHDYWTIPNRKEIVTLISFLSSLNWYQQEKLVIVFNEVNHAKEWGGKIDPLAYTYILKFTSNWLRSENQNFKILPAAMDLAAADRFPSMEAFNYLETMYRLDPEIFNYIDYWNSHSYPNPGFSASPRNNGQNSLKGFTFELNYIKEKTGRDLPVFITETGWVSHYPTNFYLSDYYVYALEHVWSDDRIKAVTPFVLKGDPGPFATFSFFDFEDKPTIHTFALKRALKKLSP